MHTKCDRILIFYHYSLFIPLLLAYPVEKPTLDFRGLGLQFLGFHSGLNINKRSRYFMTVMLKIDYFKQDQLSVYGIYDMRKQKGVS